MEYQTKNFITIEFEHTIEAIIEFNLFHMSLSPSIRLQKLVGQIITASFSFCGALAVSYILRARVLTSFDYLVALAISIGSFYFLPYLQRRDIIRGYHKISKEGYNKAVLGHQTISLTPENIFIKAPGSESRINWSSIDRIEQNEKFIFLYISSMSAIVIPKIVFSADNSLSDFLNYINAHREPKT